MGRKQNKFSYPIDRPEVEPLEKPISTNLKEGDVVILPDGIVGTIWSIYNNIASIMDSKGIFYRVRIVELTPYHLTKS